MKVTVRSDQHWSMAKNYIPEKGEIVVYEADDLNKIPRTKIGDGCSPMHELKFSSIVYYQEEEPIDAPIGAYWIQP